MHHSVLWFRNTQGAAQMSAGHLTSIRRILISEVRTRGIRPQIGWSGWSGFWVPGARLRPGRHSAVGARASSKQVLEERHWGYTPLQTRSPDTHILEGADNLQGSSPLTLTQMAQPVGGRAAMSTEVCHARKHFVILARQVL